MTRPIRLTLLLLLASPLAISAQVTLKFQTPDKSSSETIVSSHTIQVLPLGGMDIETRTSQKAILKEQAGVRGEDGTIQIGTVQFGIGQFGTAQVGTRQFRNAQIGILHELLLYWVTNPPSTAMLCPVTNDAESEQSQITASAISSGVPIRPTGSIPIASSSV